MTEILEAERLAPSSSYLEGKLSGMCFSTSCNPTHISALVNMALGEYGTSTDAETDRDHGSIFLLLFHRTCP